MTWSRTNYTVGAGDWGSAGTWNAGVPDIDDYVDILHNVSGNTSGMEVAGLYINGGKIQFENDSRLYIKDAAGTHPHGVHILLNGNSASGWDTSRGKLGSTRNRVQILSKNTNPTNRVKMQVNAIAGPDTRVLDFSWAELRDFAIFLGNEDNHVWFNTGDPDNNGIVSQPLPVQRSQNIGSFFIDGRKAGRVRRRGGHAGTIDINGIIPWASMDWQTICDMRDNIKRVAFIGQWVSMPTAIIEDLRPGRKDGMYMPFTLTLIEDI